MSSYGGTMPHFSINAPYGNIDLGPISRRHFIHVNASLMEISFCYRRIYFTKVITVKFCAWHDFCTVVVCVQFCNDMVPKDGVTRKPNICPPICIKMENRWWNGPLAQHWFGQWLVSCLAQAITRTTVDSTVVGILAFTWVMGDPQCSLLNKFVLGYTDLGFLFFSETLFWACRKI